MPAEPLPGDLAVCPEPWGATVPAEGQNDGYTVAGQDRSFWLMLPPATFTGPRPLFVAWNGTGETGQSFSERAKLEAFTARGFIVLAPDDVGNGTVWPVWDAMHAPGDDVPDENPDLLLFDSLVACAAGHMSIDKNRVYTGGHSAGGIMANYMLRHRSDLFAGGIVASGVFSLTGPNEPSPLDEMMVIVTWGGDSDGYSGGAGEVDVPEINFVEQASLASLYYDEEPAVGQANCTADVGHAWLDAANDWMIDLLLAHPKSLGSDDVVVEPTPEGSGVTCKLEPFQYEGGIVSECPTQTTVAGCDKSCQFVADCAVENGTVGPDPRAAADRARLLRRPEQGLRRLHHQVRVAGHRARRRRGARLHGRRPGGLDSVGRASTAPCRSSTRSTSAATRSSTRSTAPRSAPSSPTRRRQAS